MAEDYEASRRKRPLMPFFTAVLVCAVRAPPGECDARPGRGLQYLARGVGL
jgi:hypothetical protein